MIGTVPASLRMRETAEEIRQVAGRPGRRMLGMKILPIIVIPFGAVIRGALSIEPASGGIQ